MLAHVVNKVRYVELHYDLWIDISFFSTQNCFYTAYTDTQSRRNEYIVINNLQYRKGAMMQWLTLNTLKLEMCVRDRLFHFQTQLLYKK